MKKKLLQIITALVINLILAWPISYAVSISNINHQVTDKSALITWETDEHAKSKVYYGVSESIDRIKYNNTLVKEHSIKLSKLSFNTLYYYKVQSCDSEYKCNISELLDFTTENIPPPDKITGLQNMSVTTTTISLKWDKSTSQYLKHYLVYRNNNVVGNVTINSFTDSGLTALTTYSYQVSAVDTGGNIGEKSDTLTVSTAEPDLTAPEITEIKIAALSVNSATITWITNEDSNSTLYYGETGTLDNVQGLSIYTKYHSIQISGLTNGTVYYYKVESCDISGNCGLSSLDEFVPGADTSIPTIDILLPQYHNKKTIHITGKTKPYSEVKFYVNGVYRGILDKSSTGADGKIDIELRGLEEGNNTIKIVVVDSHNLKSEKEFSVVVDIRPPQYTISSIPKLSKQRNLIISGTVNEPCTITFYSHLVSEGIRTLKKVQNFHSDYEKLTPNSVTLVWDELEEIDYYAIYRNDVGLIGMPIKQPFVDRYANTSTTYNYEIAAVYKDCSVGPRVSITVTTLDGGNVNVRKLIPLQARCTGVTPKGSINVENQFTYSLGLNPGLNEVIVNISDRAGNSVLIKNKTIHDNSPPRIIYSNLDKLSPSYTKDVTIEGKVSEHAIVYVYIDDEKEASYIAETDEEGEFSVEVDLRRKVSGEYEVRPSSVNVRGESQPIWENDIKIIAIDDVGLESNSVMGSIAYQLCGYGGDWNIEIGEVTPDILIPRLLLQGVARIGFNVNFKWQGPGESKDATITERPHVRLRPLNRIDQEKYDEEFFGSTQEAHSNYYRSAYFLIGLRRSYIGRNLTTLEQENNLSEHNLGKCIVPGFGCIKLPLMLEIHYSYKDPYGTTLTGTLGEEHDPLARRREEPGYVYGTQRQCLNVEIAIDRRLPIDRLLPKSLLKNMVKGIDGVIKGIDTVLEPINTAKKFVFIGCLGSWVVWLFFKFKEWIACKAGSVLSGDGFNWRTCDPDEGGDKGSGCASCLKAKGETIKLWEKISWICDRVICPAAPTVQKYVRDADKEKNRLSKLIPEDLREKSHCEEKGVGDIEWERKKNDDVDKIYRDADEYWLEVRNVEDTVAGYPNEEYCESEYIKNYDSVAIFMNEFKESKCLADPEAEGCGKGFQIPNILRSLRGVCEAKESKGPRLISSQGNTYLITDYPLGIPVISEKDKIRTAYEVTQKTEVSLKINEKEKNNYFEVEQGGYFIQNFANQLGITGEYKGQKVYVRPEKEIMDENDCYTGQNKFDPSREYIEYDDIIDLKRRKELRIDEKDNPTWTIANFKEQFCGIASEDIIPLEKAATTDIVTIEDLDYILEDGKWYAPEFHPPAGKDFERFDNDQFSKKLNSNSVLIRKNEDGKEVTYIWDPKAAGFIKKGETGEKRKCVNIPRAVWEEVCGDDAKDYVIDPTGDLISAFQAGCLTAISSYLTQYKTMLKMIKHCFEQLLYTGEGSSGVCKQMLSVYICDLIYYAIRCIAEKAGRGYGKEKIGTGVFGFINYLRDGGSNIQNSIRGRYGTSTIYRTMFVERKLIHSACALAFTGDYDLDIDAMIDAQIVTPIKTMCYLSGNRRFGYANPQSGRATFIYNLGVFIVSGGSAGALTTGGGGAVTTTTGVTRPLIKPIRYRVQLVCSNTNNCHNDISETGACDCLTYSGEMAERGNQGEIAWTIPVGDGTLEQGETLNEEVYYDRAINLPYRFDKARILISYVDNQGVEHIDEVCGETYLEGIGAKPPAMCKFDITQGFICEFEWGEFVTAYFDRVMIKSDRPREEEIIREELRIGDIIELEGYIRKEGSTQKMEEQKIWLRYRLYTTSEDFIDNYIKVKDRNTDLETDPDFARDGYAFPAIRIVDKGDPKYDEPSKILIDIDPFETTTTKYIRSWTDSGYLGFRVDLPDVNRYNLFRDVKVIFTKGVDKVTYEFPGKECTNIGNTGDYTDKGLVCTITTGITGYDKININIKGMPTKNEILHISNTPDEQSKSRRQLYLEISLHTGEDDRPQTTVLTYNKDRQIKTFDFYVYREAREEEEKEEEPEKSCGGKLLETAERAIGAPECFGAEEWPPGEVKIGNCKGKTEYPECDGVANDKGVCSLDCSTFTQWVYNTYAKENNDKMFEIKESSANWQANNVGNRVVGEGKIRPCGVGFDYTETDFSNLQPGDLLFFCNTNLNLNIEEIKKISHAGIYVGDGKMIHVSSSPTEGGVVIADIGRLGYNYAWARRVCPNET